MIYFIQNAVNNHIKIGFTAKPVRRRRSNLQTGNSAKLVLLGMMQGDQAMETALHQRFAECISLVTGSGRSPGCCNSSSRQAPKAA